METLQWKVDGEFICDIARTWFWDENKPYEKCEELLLCVLVTDELSLDEKKKIAQDILEGRKKLIGINEFELVDDNQLVRPISEKLYQLNNKILALEIEKDMEINPLNYVDPYSTVRSIEELDSDFYSYKTLYEYFCYSELDFDHKNDLSKKRPYTKCGLWLFDNSKMISKVYGKKAPMVGTQEADEFWKKIYEDIKSSNKSEFIERNEKYLASLRIKEEKRGLENNTYLNNKVYMNDNVDFERPLELDPVSYAKYLMNLEPGDVDYIVLPDNMEKFEGLIDKNGSFYSCSFGGHNIKAFHIITTNYKDFGFSSRREALEVLRADKALDNLVEHGWIATRYLPSIGNYLTYSNNPNFRPSKDQKNRIWDLIVKYDTEIDNTSILM